MSDITLQEMQQMQNLLQEKYLDKWGGLSPEKSVRMLLWMYGELGEAADVIKKEGIWKIQSDPLVRQHFVEELCDAMMYFNDILLCFDISPEEFQKIYHEKHNKNMNRW